jgi:uncharacterized RDD family membrane protein YckC
MAIFAGVALVFAVPAFAIFFFAYAPEIADSSAAGDPVPWGFFVGLFAIEIGFLVLLMGLYYLYYVEYQLRRGGQTVGKRVMKVRVTPLDPAGRLNRGMLAKRWLVQAVAGSFIPFFSYLDGFWQLWDKPFQQCLHDKFAQTVVVKVNP